MTTALEHRSCANHPERPGRALCMSCKKVVCQECATQWDGINYCKSCLSRRRSAAQQHSTAAGLLLLAFTVLLLFYLTSRIMVWAGKVLVEIF